GGAGLAAALAGTAALDLAPALPPLKRHLLLARLVLQRGVETPAQAALLARELARLLDDVQTERLSFDRLAAIVPEQHAAHWQLTLEFLKVLTERWPEVLAEHGHLDA